MTDSLPSSETLAHLAALARALEDAGQINISMLLRAATDALVRRAAFDQPLPMAGTSDPFAAEVERAAADLSRFETTAPLAGALQKGAAALRAGRLPLADEIPHPFVCRTCGHVELGAPRKCPVCGAWAETFQEFMPIYWLNALDPYSALSRLRETPRLIAALAQDLSESALAQSPPDGSWSMRQVLIHLRDAQGVLDFRSALILAEDDPVLESQAVFEWAAREQADPPPTRAILREYEQVRAQILARLENIPLAAWWRKGRHLEFGPVTLTQQASYFATHELIHLPRLEALRRAVGAFSPAAH